MKLLVTAIMASLALVVPVDAQQGRDTRAPAQTPAPEAEPPLPSYDPDLVKLAEAMGSIAFLRVLCTGVEEPVWREKMAALMDSEAKTPARRERLTATYNRGYRSYALVYRSCTPSAQEALIRLAREGEALSRMLAGRFGG
jgi:uncharacterized protein (TIGR02301 family)